ncbi:hypothetical protein NEMIN01_1122 [Nematocida minor]|uniref:uncharacterized protein n=1 Tax=Nematocida minor TaxID=1912983 RepID=UPI00221F0F3A|nr:uncharacterized protein NEMIN01_1122 [Nematocida minor]KAI5190657.1 hypothetical protein NEMIN01_1122 [Nematocida minor]
MLSKSMRSISRIDMLETVDNKTFSGAAEIDRRMNVKINSTFVRGTEVRYIVLSDDEIEKVANSLQREHAV